MIWEVMAGAAALGIGPVAFRNQMNGFLALLGLAGLVLFGFALSAVEDVTDHIRCELGNNVLCGEIQRAAAIASWPKQAIVSGWTAQQMLEYQDDDVVPHHWTMLRNEVLSGAQVVTRQYCVGSRYPKVTLDYLQHCYDRQVVTPGPAFGVTIATPGRTEPMSQYDLDRLNQGLKYATAPKMPGYIAFHCQ